ncbi:hypothetical protein UFOVP1339_45 [uncultured Caudovirales phage]|uniref:Uncharacterized protein n=1 Tax=uncultured Caudovirales phage TaxID=2100421 RepID=A0A6J5S0S5_9CAUD|nr:hypothetical protein UFOVP1339_45 [uncultured Caudovirales phage]
MDASQSHGLEGQGLDAARGARRREPPGLGGNTTRDPGTGEAPTPSAIFPEKNQPPAPATAPDATPPVELATPEPPASILAAPIGEITPLEAQATPPEAQEPEGHNPPPKPVEAPQELGDGKALEQTLHRAAVRAAQVPEARYAQVLDANGERVVSPEEIFDHFVDTYRNRPVQFVEDLLLKDHPEYVIEEWQKDLLKAIASGERRISVRAGHGVGKSAVCAWASIWFMFTRFPQKTVMTAPSAGQLFDALYAEIKRWVKCLPPNLKEAVEVFADHIVLRSAPESSFMSARTSSSDKPEALAGIHSANVLLICDEASAIAEAVYEAAVGSMSGFNACTVLISNPTRNSGLFFKTHHNLKTNWKTFHVSCLNNRLVHPDFIKQIVDTYGEESNQYRVRVLGDFATKEDDVLITADLVDAAMDRDIVLNPGEDLVYGLDVARFGSDRSALLKRRGNVVTEITSWHGNDLMETTGRVAAEANIDHPSEIMVDSIGVGAGVADRLRELGFNVRDVNVSETAAMNPQAFKLRDELWLTTKDWLNTRAVKLPKNDQLRQELCTPTYNFASNGSIKVESKAEMKKRGLRSPDIADALCLTFAGQASFVGGRASKWITGKPLKRSIRGVT